MSELTFNGLSKKELLQIFRDNTQSTSTEMLREKGIDFTLQADEPAFLTIKKTTWVQVRCTLTISSDEYLTDFAVPETKLVKVDDDPDTAYCLARDGCFSRIFERLGCKQEEAPCDPEPVPAPKRKRKSQKAEEPKVTPAEEEIVETPSEAAEQPQNAVTEKVVETTSTEKTPVQEPSDAQEDTPTGETQNINVIIIEPFVKEATCLKGVGKLPDDQTVDVIIDEGRYDLIKAKMSLNCFIKRQVVGTEMTFSGYIENTSDRPRAYLTGSKTAVA